MIIIYLDLCKIGNTIFAFCKNAMTSGAIRFVKNLSFFCSFNKQCFIFRRHVTGNIIFCLLLRNAFSKHCCAKNNDGYGICTAHAFQYSPPTFRLSNSLLDDAGSFNGALSKIIFSFNDCMNAINSPFSSLFSLRESGDNV